MGVADVRARGPAEGEVDQAPGGGDPGGGREPDGRLRRRLLGAQPDGRDPGSDRDLAGCRPCRRQRVPAGTPGRTVRHDDADGAAGRGSGGRERVAAGTPGRAVRHDDADGAAGRGSGGRERVAARTPGRAVRHDDADRGCRSRAATDANGMTLGRRVARSTPPAGRSARPFMARGVPTSSGGVAVTVAGRVRPRGGADAGDHRREHDPVEGFGETSM